MLSLSRLLTPLVKTGYGNIIFTAVTTQFQNSKLKKIASKFDGATNWYQPWFEGIGYFKEYSVSNPGSTITMCSLGGIGV